MHWNLCIYKSGNIENETSTEVCFMSLAIKFSRFATNQKIDITTQDTASRRQCLAARGVYIIDYWLRIGRKIRHYGWNFAILNLSWPLTQIFQARQCSAAPTLNVDFHPPDSHDSPSTASSDRSFCLFCQPCRRLGEAMLDKVVEKRVISAAWNLIFLPGPPPIGPASFPLRLSDWLVGGTWPIFSSGWTAENGREWRRNKNIYLVFLRKLVG